jgi:hypothetical protein
MTPTWQSAAQGLVGDLRNVFGDRLRSVVAYGPYSEGHEATAVTCLALVTSHGVADFEACARHAARWRRNRIATPLVLSETEFQTSLDAFPLEYGEIIRAHQRVYGSDPFDGVTIAPADLRRACEMKDSSSQADRPRPWPTSSRPRRRHLPRCSAMSRGSPARPSASVSQPLVSVLARRNFPTALSRT